MVVVSTVISLILMLVTKSKLQASLAFAWRDEAEEQSLRVYRSFAKDFSSPLMTDIEVISGSETCADRGLEPIFNVKWPGTHSTC